MTLRTACPRVLEGHVQRGASVFGAMTKARHLIPAILLCAASVGTRAAEPVDLGQINRIIDAAVNHSEVMNTAAYLSDRIGGRMTNSPQMRRAEAWTQEVFRRWGLHNVRAEPFPFGRGWSIRRSNVRMTSPRELTLRAIPIAWTPATRGTLNAPIIVAPMASESDFAQWRGRLAGRIVLVSAPGEGSEPDQPAFRRYSDEDLQRLRQFQQPEHSAALRAQRPRQRAFPERLDAFLASENAVAWIRISPYEGGLVGGVGYSHQIGQTPRLPAVEMAAEDYRRLARLAGSGPPVTLELMNDVEFHDEDPNAYNIMADIPGRDGGASYVLAGAHLDSWVAGDGAADDGAGVAVVMEAARILSSLHVRPRRTIRFALWAGEEQGSVGSLSYVTRNFATRPPERDPALARLGETWTWRNRYPITLLPGYADLAAYFNVDNGSGRIRGIYAEGNQAVVPIFQEWFAPFASMGATTVSIGSITGSDHIYMKTIGLPAFQFIQDPLDYRTRVHHTSADTFDHLKAEDMRQASIILASFLLMAAERDEPLPRMPLPTRPQDTVPAAAGQEE